MHDASLARHSHDDSVLHAPSAVIDAHDAAAARAASRLRSSRRSRNER